MKKRTMGIIMVIFSAIILTGCASTIDLTDEQNEAIAEYAAELLLKYDSNYSSKYKDAIYGEDKTENLETIIDDTNTEATTETTTDTTTEATTEEIDASSTPDDSNNGEGSEAGEQSPP